MEAVERLEPQIGHEIVERARDDSRTRRREAVEAFDPSVLADGRVNERAILAFRLDDQDRWSICHGNLPAEP